jgi:hypothetical protein
MIRPRWSSIAAWACLPVLFPLRARAFDPYEIQVYDGTADPRGVPAVELHLNTVPTGRKEFDPPELPAHQQSHFTLEPSYGITDWWEVGGYLQTTLERSGTFSYAGVKLRTKFVTRPGWDAHWRLGVNFEVSLLPEKFDRDRWGTEVRPIVAWEDELWHFAFNPIVDTSLAGAGWSEGPSFDPAFMAKIKIEGKVAVGIETYSDFGPIANPASWSNQVHYVFEAFDLLSVRNFELNAGIGEGLTAASNALIVKVIVGFGWESPEQK